MKMPGHFCLWKPYAAFFCFAQRAFCAAAIRARPSALMVLRFGAAVALGLDDVAGLRPA